MLTRLAVIGGNEELCELLRQASQGTNLEVAAVPSGESVPCGAAAVAGADAGADALVGAALTVGAWNEQVLDLLAEAIDCREGFFIGSSRRVKEHASRFAEALGLNANDRFVLERSACVRDIGKLKIPNQVLLKEGVLTYDEWVLLQQHPEIGAEMVERMGGLKDTADVVRFHHECYDGDGYPRGLEGEQIPYLARVMKIIDVYCAMTSPRHYREGHSTHEEAVEYLQSERGKHYDPGLLDAFAGHGVGRSDTVEAAARQADTNPPTPVK